MPFIKNAVVLVGKPYSPAPIPLGETQVGTQYSLYLNTDGRLWAWGSNNRAQLAGATTFGANICTPNLIGGAVKTFCKISTAESRAHAIDKNGRLWSWGASFNLAFGDGTSTTVRQTPVSVAGATKTFCEISAGGDFTLAIDKNGRAWSWGHNSSGALGDNTTTNRNTPVSIAGVTKTFCKISAGLCHSLAIDKNGRVWGWGYNVVGELGDNTTTQRNTPVSILGVIKTFCEISLGACHTLAIDKNGRLWSWGQNTNGQLGDNTVLPKRTPVSVAGAVKTFCKIAAGEGHSIAIDNMDRIWSWGNNPAGEIGDGTSLNKNTPVSILGDTKTFCKIYAGNHGIAIDKNGRVWGWGANSFGQIGNNSITVRRTPVSVLGSTKTFCQISVNRNHSAAIDKNGRVWAWGDNSYGTLGDNSITRRCTPVAVLGVTKTFCKIGSGGLHTVAIDKNGQAWGWGDNSYGTLGDNTVTSKRTPVLVLGTTKTFCEIATGGCHTMAIDKYGRAWGWGANSFDGYLGDNSISNRCTPVSVLGAVKTFCKISAGEQHSLAIDKNGRAWGWGNGSSGRTGINSTATRRTPASVVGTVKTFCQISAGGEHSVAIDKNGRVWSWGNNFYGQLGDGTLTCRCTPVSIAGTSKTFCEISAGISHSVAIDKNGRVWVWGYNVDGQLGNNYTRLTPVRVCNL